MCVSCSSHKGTLEATFEEELKEERAAFLAALNFTTVPPIWKDKRSERFTRVIVYAWIALFRDIPAEKQLEGLVSSRRASREPPTFSAEDLVELFALNSMVVAEVGGGCRTPPPPPPLRFL